MKKMTLLMVALTAVVASHAAAAAVLGTPLVEAGKSLGPTDAKCHLTACYQGGLYALGATDSKTSIIYHYWLDKDFSLSGSRAIALRLAPSDAKLVKSKTADNGTVVELYRSPQLGKAFSAKSDVWGDAPAGTFTVMHSPRGRKTIVSLGQQD